MRFHAFLHSSNSSFVRESAKAVEVKNITTNPANKNSFFIIHPVKEIVLTLGILSCTILFFLLLSKASFAAPPQRNTLILIEQTFQQKARVWGTVLQGYALTLFRYLLIGNVAWMGIQLLLQQADIKSILVRFIQLLFSSALMLATLFHYKEWAGMLIRGLGKIGQELGAPLPNPNAILNNGIEVIYTIAEQISLAKPAVSLGMVVCGIVIVICFALIAAQVLLVKCEAYIVLNAGTILLGFGGADLTRNYATNFLKYSLTVAAKLFVMQLLVSLGASFISDLNYGEEIQLTHLLVLIGVSVVLFALVKTIPDIISGIINGSHVSTGNAITSAVSSVAMGTMATMGAMKAAGLNSFDGTKAVREAANMANAEGASGLGKAGHMAKNLGAEAFANRGNMMRNIHSGLKGKSELLDLMGSAEQAPEPPIQDQPYESPAVDLTQGKVK